jgi:glycosyltransferase involved in cell wall biosynthesis
VICTRNRPELLVRALASLAEQTLELSRFETIVVDNGGGVEELARGAGADVALRVREPGVSRARNAGWRAATSELIAFIDDDAVASPTWLEEALRVWAHRAESVAALGGPILPLWDVDPPSWFPERIEERWFGDVERVLAPGEPLSGSNVFFARGLLERLGGFDIRLGPIGNRLGVGEETDVFVRMAIEMPPPLAVYSPAIVVRHSVAPYKLSVRYQLRRAAASGESRIIQQHPSLRERPHLAASHTRDLLRLTRVALRRGRRPLRRWAVEELEPVATHLGMIRAVLSGK